MVAAQALVVVMGVSGSGKSAVGRPLASRLGVPFGEGDDFHSRANIAKLHAGHALDDNDRAPWLVAIGSWLHHHRDSGAAVSCSALRRRHRHLLLSASPGTVFLHLRGDRVLLQDRMAHRSDHFMPASLLDSQLATLEPLEPDEPGVTFDTADPVDQIVDGFLRWYKDRPKESR